MIASILLTHHNLAFFLDTMRKVRDSIKLGIFTDFRREFLYKISEGDTEADTTVRLKNRF